MASEVDICNRALQKLGAATIVDFNEESVEARECSACYETLRDAELRSHVWNFSIARAELAADSSATGPEWGRARSYQLPSDFLRLADDYPEDVSNDKDWIIEGRKILSDDSDPIYIRYVKKVTDPEEMDVMFREVLAARIAKELCERLTQSNTKMAALNDDYRYWVKEAKRVNAFEQQSAEPQEDTWITARF